MPRKKKDRKENVKRVFLNVLGSKSGKLTTSLAQYWTDHILVPLVGDKKMSALK